MQTSFYFWGSFKKLAVLPAKEDSFHTVRTHQQQRSKQIHTNLLNKSYHLSFDATKNAASLSTTKIHVELSSTKICQLLPSHKKAVSLPIERKQLFPGNREGPDCLECLNWEQQQLEPDFLLTPTPTHTHTHTEDDCHTICTWTSVKIAMLAHKQFWKQFQPLYMCKHMLWIYMEVLVTYLIVPTIIIIQTLILK